MSSAAYAGHVVLVAVVVAAAWVSGRSVRRVLLPGWAGAPASLATAVSSIAVALLGAELLGAVGAFERWPFTGALVAAAAILSFGERRRRPRRDGEADAPRVGRWPIAVAASVLAYAATRSFQSTADALHAGITSYDSLWYHLPFAARFVQDGSLTGLQFVGNAPTTFYPANGEVVHALGILLVGSDVLSPVINLAWLALALLAGWCVGRPYGVAPATTVAIAIAAFVPAMGAAQAGTAGTDVAVLALLVAAVALVVNDSGSARATVLPAVAAGLAVGTKLDAWSTTVALAVIAIVLARSARAAVVWTAGIVVAGGFWYVRNAADVGNPFPWFGSTTAPVDCGRTSLAHYVLRPGLFSADIVPQLPQALGARWWLVVALAAAGAITALFRGGRLAAVVGCIALVSVVAYAFTPATAGGTDGRCFAYNVRFATPALALGLLLLPVAWARLRHGPLVTTATLALTLVLTTQASHRAAPIAAAALGALCLVAARALPRPLVPVLALVVVVLLVVVGRHEERVYARDHYTTTTFGDAIEQIALRLRDARGARVAVAGFAESYPLYGVQLSNRVDYPARRHGARFEPYTTCADWLAALRAGGYDDVVVGHEGAAEAPQAAWTRLYPGARELVSSGHAVLHRGRYWTWHLYRLPEARLGASVSCARARGDDRRNG